MGRLAVGPILIGSAIREQGISVLQAEVPFGFYGGRFGFADLFFDSLTGFDLLK
jgi:hypothetical protein